MLWGIYSAIYGEVNVSVEKCVEMKGDYVEKQQSCSISVTLKSWSGQKLLDPTTYLPAQWIKFWLLKLLFIPISSSKIMSYFNLLGAEIAQSV